jgi:hypothetical protein
LTITAAAAAAIKGMGWPTKSLQNNCWRFFDRFLLPPRSQMSGLKKNSLKYVIMYSKK